MVRVAVTQGRAVVVVQGHVVGVVAIDLRGAPKVGAAARMAEGRRERLQVRPGGE